MNCRTQFYSSGEASLEAKKNEVLVDALGHELDFLL